MGRRGAAALAAWAACAAACAAARGNEAGGAAGARAALAFSDQRLKDNVTAADPAALLAALERVQLREFDFVYEQFYNKVFGRRQLGVIAQELVQVLPRAVGVVERRMVGGPEDDEPTVLEGVHVLNPEHMFMANVGATQELARLAHAASRRIEELSRTLDSTVLDLSSTQQATAELGSLKSRQSELESLAREAHARSANAARLEQAMSALEKQSEAHGSGYRGLQDKVDRLDDRLRAEAREHDGLHRELASEAGKLALTLDSLKANLDAARVEAKDAAREATTKADAAKVAVAELDARAQGWVADARAAASAAEAKAQASLDELRATVDSLQEQITELRAAVEAQAGAEIIEQRRILEAQVELEKTKAQAEQARAEEARKTAREQARIEEQRANATLARLREEESVRAERELETIRAKEAAAVREAAARAEAEKSVQAAAAAAELEALKVKASAARETALAEAEAETRRERENHDLRLEMAKHEAESARLHTAETIRTASAEAVALARLAASNPAYVAGAIGMLALLALGVFGAREAMTLWRTYWERRLGQPALVRETSQSRRAGSRIAKVGSRAVAPLRLAAAAAYRRVAKTDESDEARKARELATLRDRSFKAYMNDVILAPTKAEQINRIARSTRAAHRHGSALRHVMFYGPPGTGKSMVCRHLARWCGLDYAIMSGADVAPLRERAVTELHALFSWAAQTPRGVLLFIDEADAFLASRDNGDLSESLRNALTALLFHTGSASSKIMLVLATNRPGDLDRAVVDRIDEAVQFDLPSERERELLVEQYYASTVAPTLDGSDISNKVLRETAKRLNGFSGREVAKLMTSLQAHVFGHESDTHHLTNSLFNQVVDNAIREHNKLGTFQGAKEYRFTREE